MEGKKYIVIPVHTETLVVTEDMFLANQELDFAELPYFNSERQRDQNADVPYTAQSIGDEAFNSQHLLAQAGIHLHWHLPQPSAKGVEKNGCMVFPAIPNRWLVTRTYQGKQKQWVVESDYLFSPQKHRAGKAIAIPYPPSSEGIPYRFMGRTYTLEAWLQKEQYLANPEGSLPEAERMSMEQAMGTPEYFRHQRLFPDEQDPLKGLTVLGYGNDKFSTFYPNCHSVLGFYDGEMDAGDLPDLRYEILGWYARPEEDPMRAYFEQARINLRNGTWTQADFEQDFALHHDLAWASPDAGTAGMMAYSVVEFGAEADVNLDLNLDAGAFNISVGVSGPETLSARMAEKVLRQRTPQAGRATGDLRGWEKRLEALQVLGRLKAASQDWEARFQELRHGQEFLPEYGGIAWKISHQTSTPESAPDRPMLIPPEMRAQLEELNALQAETERVEWEVEEMEKQLFADWYKYVQSIYPTDPVQMVYPDLEMVRYYIREATARPLQGRQDRLRTLLAQLAIAKETLESEVKFHNGQNENREKLELLPTVPTPFYSPKEPVVLVEGEAATRKTTQFLHPECLSVEVAGGATWEFGQLAKARLAALPEEEKAKWPFVKWEKQPWSPYFLEWEVSFLPTVDGSNLTEKPSNAGEGFHQYSPDYLTRNYTAPLTHPYRDGDRDLPHSPDWELRPEKGRVLPVQKAYSGRTYLSPVDHVQVMKRMEDLLAQQLQVPKEAWESWDPEEKDARMAQSADPKRFYLQLADELQQTAVLSQAMGGFNLGLLQRKAVQDLPIDDPVNFPLFRLFSQNLVSALVGTTRQEAPVPLQYFHPWRAGCLRIRRLALLDTFGRIFQPNLAEIPMHLPTRLQVPGNPNLVKLVPRLAQPARLRLDWQMPGSRRNPLCGWIMLNALNHTLMVFEPDGEWAGQLAEDGWHDEAHTPMEEFAGIGITQPDLRQFVVALGEESLQREGGWQRMMEQLAAAQRQISPETWANPSTAAILGGRPLALVRGQLWLELKGGTRLNQSWRAFEEDMLKFIDTLPEEREKDIEKAYRQRDRAAYDKVKVPVQLGAASRKSDGLVAVWEEETGNGNNYRYKGGLTILADGNRSVHDLTADGKRVPLTLLCDPQADLHMISGILPVTAQHLAPEYWENAIRKLEFQSLPMPILTPAKQVRVPLQHGPDMDWKWRTQNPGGEWVECDTEGYVTRDAFLELANQAEWVRNPENHLSPTLLWDAAQQAQWIRQYGRDWQLNAGKRQALETFPACPIPQGQLETLLNTLLEKAETRIREMKMEPEWSAGETDQPVFPRLRVQEGVIRLKPRKD